MNALLIDPQGSHSLVRAPLQVGESEKWLQGLLFEHPELIPLDRIEGRPTRLIPLCRELALPRAGGAVFLDLLAVTDAGRLVLIECKLWRNPQARREVLAQILEYAALLRRWTISDLTARLKAQTGSTAANPAFAVVSRATGLTDEAFFTDSLARNLRSGDFQLIVAGDGIREEVTAIAEHLGDQGARLALVEFQIWQDQMGRRLVMPHLPFRTEVLRQRIITDTAGAPVALSDDEGDEMADIETQSPFLTEGGKLSRRANRHFWDAYIAAAHFDHPEQQPARHAGNNWVKLILAPPARWLTAYRYQKSNSLGFYLVHQDHSGLLEFLIENGDTLRSEPNLQDLRFLSSVGQPTITISTSLDDLRTDPEQIGWLVRTGNSLVNALRPMITEFSHRD